MEPSFGVDESQRRSRSSTGFLLGRVALGAWSVSDTTRRIRRSWRIPSPSVAVGHARRKPGAACIRRDEMTTTGVGQHRLQRDLKEEGGTWSIGSREPPRQVSSNVNVSYVRRNFSSVRQHDRSARLRRQRRTSNSGARWRRSTNQARTPQSGLRFRTACSSDQRDERPRGLTFSLLSRSVTDRCQDSCACRLLLSSRRGVRCMQASRSVCRVCSSRQLSRQLPAAAAIRQRVRRVPHRSIHHA